MALFQFTNRYKFHANRATGSAAQVIANNAFAVMQLDTKDFDLNGNFDNVTTFAYTVPLTGYYAVFGAAALNANTFPATAIMILSVFVNGAERFRSWQHEAEALKTGGEGSLSCDLLALTAGDLVDLRIFQNSGGNQNLVQEGRQNHLAMIFLGA